MKNTVQSQTCFHCGSDCQDAPVFSADHLFCCAGCSRVYQIIHGSQLDTYYCLNAAPGVRINDEQPGWFDVLDDPKIASGFISFASPDLVKASFYLPQIHCSSCLWLLEHLSEADKGILMSRVQFTDKRIYLSYDPRQLSLKSVAGLLKSVGYEPHIDLQQNNLSNAYDQQTAIEIGISGFCFANIMLLSFPEYFGLNWKDDGALVNFFRYINLGLGLPVFVIGVHVFFRKALSGLKQKYLNIDAPIALAILVTFLRSVYEIGSGDGMGYLDSMSGIVFFMLIGRALQNKTNRSLQFNRDYHSYFPLSVQVRDEQGIKTVPIQDIKVGEQILLKHGEVIPVDGYLSKGKRKVDYSYITGESQPMVAMPGDLLYAGGRVMGSSLELLTIKTFKQSDFLQLWNNAAFKNEKLNRTVFTDRLSKHFSLIVLGIAITTLMYWYRTAPDLAWNAFTAVLIVACPCALLLSSSFTYGHLIQRFAQDRFYTKNAAVVENLPEINHIVFDKTGTLTTQNELGLICTFHTWSASEKRRALSLMSQSSHPLSQQILQNERWIDPLEVDSFKEWTGQGIEGWVEDHHIKIGNPVFTGQQAPCSDQSLVMITIDNQLKAVYQSHTLFKAGIIDLLSRLSPDKLTLLSGDRPELIPDLKKHLPPTMKILMGQTPQQKLDFILQAQADGDRVMMVGDGLNDAGALKQSDIGVAVVDQHFSFSPACDVLIQSSELKYMDRFIQQSRQAKYLIWVGFAYSIFYNLIGIYFAIQGQLSPLIAAILMPLSSIGVMVLAYLGVRRISQF